MIGGLAHAGRVMARNDWIEAAQTAIDFLHQSLWQNGRLQASYQHGEARLNAYLDDYAFLLDALLESLQARYREADMAWACELADALLAHFEDRPTGGFFFTSHDHEALITRPKPGYDHATPSGNGVAAFACNGWGICWARHAISTPAHAACACSRRNSASSRLPIPRCLPCWMKVWLQRA